MRVAVCCVVVLLFAGAHAHAEDCSAYAFPSDVWQVQRATVTTPRAAFLRDTPDCPAAGDSCKTAAYTVQGDSIFAGRTFGAYTCATFIGPSRQVTGWVLTSALAPAPWPAPFTGTWSGDWKRVNSDRATASTMTVKAKGKDVTADFEATLVVNPNNVRTGTASGRVRFYQHGNDEFATVLDGDNDNAACKVTLRHAGDLLMVSDGATSDANSDCGGMGVSLSGFYRRAAQR